MARPKVVTAPLVTLLCPLCDEPWPTVHLRCHLRAKRKAKLARAFERVADSTTYAPARDVLSTPSDSDIE